MIKRNQFIDDDNLSELSSLTYLLDRNDNHNEEYPFYNIQFIQFIDIIAKDTGLFILYMNICKAFTKI